MVVLLLDCSRQSQATLQVREIAIGHRCRLSTRLETDGRLERSELEIQTSMRCMAQVVLDITTSSFIP